MLTAADKLNFVFSVGMASLETSLEPLPRVNYCKTRGSNVVSSPDPARGLGTRLAQADQITC